MYEVKGFIFHESKGEIHKYPISGMLASGHEEVHEAMKAMNIPHYMFILKEVKK